MQQLAVEIHTDQLEGELVLILSSVIKNSVTEENEEIMKYLLTNKFLTSNVFSPSCLVTLIHSLFYLFFSTKDEAQEKQFHWIFEGLKHLFNFWKNKSFINNFTPERLEYLSRAIIHILQLFTPSPHLLKSHPFFPTITDYLLSAVQNYISSSLSPVRRWGMVLISPFFVFVLKF